MSKSIAKYIIDAECKYKNSGCTILVQDDIVYSCTLNQTVIKDNNNKFYIMQIIKLDNGKYCHYIRYGRIGYKGTASYDDFGSTNLAIASFKEQFKKKTGNKWEDCDKFVQKKGKYFLAEISYEDDVKDDAIDKLEQQVVVPSQLDNPIQELIKLISDVNMMNNSLLELEIDTKKMPLGKISSEQINEANKILIGISNIIGIAGNNNNDELSELTSKFYTLIPYSCGFRAPPAINSNEMISKYVALLDELRNIVVGTKIIELNDKSNNAINPIDTIYNSLNANIKTVDKKSEIYMEIEKYVHNTHAPTHGNYTAELLQAYEIDRDNGGANGIYENYTKDKIGNKYLLFHGSRIANIMGITKLGLLLNPESVNPNVHITGKMFGYGIYMANSFSKAFNYCGSSKANPIACIFLCEAALGKQYKLARSEYNITNARLQEKGFDSTWGQGSKGPDMENCFVDKNNIKIPNGNLLDTAIKGGLLYDEFIVYDQRQLNIKYLLLIKSHHKY